MKLIIAFAFAVLLSTGCIAQQIKPTFNQFALGISAGQYYNDPGIMVNITTPYSNNGRWAARFTGGIRWFENYLLKKNIASNYSSLQAGVVCFITQEDRLRVYCETGFNILFPNLTFSAEKRILGVYGSLGLDFFVYEHDGLGIAYFFDGSMSLNPAKAYKLEGQSRYAYGFSPVMGFRFHF
jgi:hypothetical protein